MKYVITDRPSEWIADLPNDNAAFEFGAKEGVSAKAVYQKEIDGKLCTYDSELGQWVSPVNRYLHSRLIHFLTEYDKKQSTGGRYYNSHALGIYFKAADEALQYVCKGLAWQKALSTSFEVLASGEFTLAPVRKFIKFYDKKDKWSVQL